MNPREDQPLRTEVVQASRIPLEKLKLQFQDILFNPKYTIGADSVPTDLNSAPLSISITETSSLTLDYLEYKGHHSMLSQEGIQKLRVIAELLSTTDHFGYCVQTYIEYRKDIVILVHRRIRDRLNVETVCVFKYLEELDEKIQGWIKVARICFGTIFVIEKSFYNQVFGGLGVVEDGFANIIADVVAKLFEFPDTLLSSRRLPQRLEILLPLYQEYYTLFPDVISLLGADLQTAKKLHVYATGIMSKFKKHMTKILSVTERHLLRELSMIPTSKGEIHPLTEYVIQYMELVSTHGKALADLTNDSDQGFSVADSIPPGSDAKELEGTISLKRHLARVIEFLLYNLKFKSKFCEQESLRHLFVMNNANSIAQKIKSSQELKEIIGKRFLLKLEKKVDLSRADYLKGTWDGICRILTDGGAKSGPKCSLIFSPGKSFKNKLKTFNRRFEHVYQTQVQWKVPDEQLRQKLRECIMVKLIPAYNDFLEQFGCSSIDKVQHPNRYIKYSVAELEAKVQSLFDCQD